MSEETFYQDYYGNGKIILNWIVMPAAFRFILLKLALHISALYSVRLMF